jgi:hypothetical protein
MLWKMKYEEQENTHMDTIAAPRVDVSLFVDVDTIGGAVVDECEDTAVKECL